MLMPSSDARSSLTGANLLLQSLRQSDHELLYRDFEEVALPRGKVLLGPDELIDAIYFPTSGMLSVEERIGRRGHIETAVVGREGMLGWPSAAWVQTILPLGYRTGLERCRFTH